MITAIARRSFVGKEGKVTKGEVMSLPEGRFRELSNLKLVEIVQETPAEYETKVDEPEETQTLKPKRKKKKSSKE